MKNKAKWNYWIDIAIGIAFLVSMVSGLVLEFGTTGGFQGGRNSHFGQTFLGLDHHAWSGLHTWFSIGMAAAVLLHLVLHWNWIKCMTRNLVSGQRKKIVDVKECPNPAVAG